MKKFILILSILLFITIDANSQITKGFWLVGGSGNYTHRSVDTGVGSSKNSVITISPNVGYFVVDKFVIGSLLNYYKYKTLDNSGTYVNNFGIGLFTRYYFLKPEKVFNIFTQAHLDKDFYKNNAGSVNKGNGHSYGLAVGQVVFLNSNVGLEFSVDYEKAIAEGYVTEDIIVGIGLQIHLEKKH